MMVSRQLHDIGKLYILGKNNTPPGQSGPQSRFEREDVNKIPCEGLGYWQYANFHIKTKLHLPKSYLHYQRLVILMECWQTGNDASSITNILRPIKSIPNLELWRYLVGML
jgi:hypothetical protein